VQQQRKPREAAVKYYRYSTFIIFGLIKGKRLYLAWRWSKIIKLYFAIFAAFKESMTLNLAQRSFKVIHFCTN